ncbi:MAG: hypothetical protein B7Z72_06610, partial [Gemmatimonadetes bacterium 21-71-4]
MPLIVAIAVCALAIWAGRPYAVGVYHDDGVYVILAKALATGRGYRYLHLPGAPVAGHYPPAYPALLAMLWRVVPHFPANVRLFLLVNAVLLGVVTWYVQRVARRMLGWSDAAAAAVAIVGTATFPLLLLSGLVLSETLFLACLMPALVAAERVVAHRDDRSADATRRALWFGLAAGLVALVRTNGLALAVAVVGLLVVRRRWRTAALSVLGVAAIVTPWQLWVALHAGALPPELQGAYGSYVDWFATGLRAAGPPVLTGTLMKNVSEIGALFADRWSLSGIPTIRTATALLAGTVFVAGAGRVGRRLPATVAFAGVYLLVVLLWPFTPWRFVYAVWPVIVLCMAGAVEWAARTRSRLGRTVGFAAVAMLFVGGCRAETLAYINRSWRSGTDQATIVIAPLIRWVSSHTAPTDVVAADGEQVVYLATGRVAVPVAPFTAAEYVSPRTVAMNAASIAGLLRDTRPDYLVTIAPPLRDAARESAMYDAMPGAPRLVALDTVGQIGAG